MIPLTILMLNDAIPSSEYFSSNVPSSLLNIITQLVHQGYYPTNFQTTEVEWVKATIETYPSLESPFVTSPHLFNKAISIYAIVITDLYTEIIKTGTEKIAPR